MSGDCRHDRSRVRGGIVLLLTLAAFLLLSDDVCYCQGIRLTGLSSKIRTGHSGGINGVVKRGSRSFIDPPCSISGDPAANINLRCGDQLRPFAETSIAVDPTDPNHLLVGANDYQSPAISFNTKLSSFVSFDGGTNWTKVSVPSSGESSADPSPVFNSKFKSAHIGQVEVRCPQLRYLRSFCAYDAAVVTSHDGGLSWSARTTVANGSSYLQVLNDKPWLAADNDPASPFYGRLYLTWTRIHFAKDGSYSSPINFSYSDDDGVSWSPEVEISGIDAFFCNGPASAAHEYRCLDDQFSTPVVLPGGVVVVHFQNGDSASASEFPLESDSQTMIVRSLNGGVTWFPPQHIADLEDSFMSADGGDYPARFDGYNIQTGHEFTTWSVQGMSADPVTGVLYAFWTDNRDGVHDSLLPVTQTNVFMTRSGDAGVTWTGPIRITSGQGDRWMAWGAAYSGTVRVMYLDGSYDFPGRTLYGVTMASSTDGGATWSYQRIDTAASNPNSSYWFQTGVSGCFRCTFFIGDYQGMAIDSLGRSHIVWTDMRRTMPSSVFKAHDIEYARR